MEQEIQVKLHMSISINAKYDEKELAEIIKRNIGFRNNRTYIHNLSFIEERGIYSDEELSQWNTIYEKEDVRTKVFEDDVKFSAYRNWDGTSNDLHKWKTELQGGDDD